MKQRTTVHAILIAALAACGGRAAVPPPAAPTPSPSPPLQQREAAPLPPPEAASADETPGGLAAAAELPPEPEPEPVTAEFDPAPPAVTLLSKGKGKRERLRYVARVGDLFSCDFAMDMSVQASVPLVIPRTVVGLAGQVTTVDRRAITVAAVVDRFDVAQAPDATGQQFGQHMRTRLAPLFGATMDSTVTDRGVPGHFKIVTRGQLDPTAAAGMQVGAGSGLVVPEEPVGVGARWRVERSDQVGMMTTRSTFTFELVERVDGAAKIHGQIETVTTPLYGEPATSHGVFDGSFTGGLCAETRVTMNALLPAATPGTLTTMLTSAPRP